MPKYLENPAAPGGRVMADGEGRFFFTDLPAGRVLPASEKDGYAPGEYGDRRAWGQSQLLSLAEGERLTDITLKVWKYGVIAGTVVDEAGEPVVGVAVRALIKRRRRRTHAVRQHGSDFRARAEPRRLTIAACSGSRS